MGKAVPVNFRVDDLRQDIVSGFLFATRDVLLEIGIHLGDLGCRSHGIGQEFMRARRCPGVEQRPVFCRQAHQQGRDDCRDGFGDDLANIGLAILDEAVDQLMNGCLDCAGVIRDVFWHEREIDQTPAPHVLGLVLLRQHQRFGDRVFRKNDAGTREIYRIGDDALTFGIARHDPETAVLLAPADGLFRHQRCISQVLEIGVWGAILADRGRQMIVFGEEMLDFGARCVGGVIHSLYPSRSLFSCGPDKPGDTRDRAPVLQGRGA